MPLRKDVSMRAFAITSLLSVGLGCMWGGLCPTSLHESKQWTVVVMASCLSIAAKAVMSRFAWRPSTHIVPHTSEAHDDGAIPWVVGVTRAWADGGVLQPLAVIWDALWDPIPED
eukprot:15366017-Ditylum_brightwellii.AAC.1